MSPAPCAGGAAEVWGAPLGAGLSKGAQEVARLLQEEEDEEDYVALRILSVQGLTADSENERLNPYVVARCGFTEQRTTTLRDCNEPRWEDDHELIFPMPRGLEDLEMEVMSERSVFQSALLGRAWIRPWECKKNEWHHLRLRLQGTTGVAQVILECKVLVDVASASDADKTLHNSVDKKPPAELQQHQQVQKELFRAELVVAQAELQKKEEDWRARQKANALPAQGEIVDAATAAKRQELESQISRQQQRLQDLSDSLQQRHARVAELQQTLGLGRSAQVAGTTANGHHGSGGETKRPVPDVAGSVSKEGDEGPLAALSEELRHRLEKTQALRTIEQQLQGELRSNFHEDHPPYANLSASAKELRQVLAEAVTVAAPVPRLPQPVQHHAGGVDSSTAPQGCGASAPSSPATVSSSQAACDRNVIIDRRASSQQTSTPPEAAALGTQMRPAPPMNFPGACFPTMASSRTSSSPTLGMMHTRIANQSTAASTLEAYGPNRLQLGEMLPSPRLTPLQQQTPKYGCIVPPVAAGALVPSGSAPQICFQPRQQPGTIAVPALGMGHPASTGASVSPAILRRHPTAPVSPRSTPPAPAVLIPPGAAMFSPRVAPPWSEPQAIYGAAAMSTAVPSTPPAPANFTGAAAISPRVATPRIEPRAHYGAGNLSAAVPSTPPVPANLTGAATPPAGVATPGNDPRTILGNATITPPVLPVPNVQGAATPPLGVATPGNEQRAILGNVAIPAPLLPMPTVQGAVASPSVVTPRTEQRAIPGNAAIPPAVLPAPTAQASVAGAATPPPGVATPRTEPRAIFGNAAIPLAVRPLPPAQAGVAGAATPPPSVATPRNDTPRRNASSATIAPAVPPAPPVAAGFAMAMPRLTPRSLTPPPNSVSTPPGTAAAYTFGPGPQVMPGVVGPGSIAASVQVPGWNSVHPNFQSLIVPPGSISTPGLPMPQPGQLQSQGFPFARPVTPPPGHYERYRG